MSRLGAITRFASGTYSVARYGAATWADGIGTKPAPSTFSIVASVQPVGGREIAGLPEGRRGQEVRVVYTATLLRAGGSDGVDADIVTIGGEPWEVFRVETWEAWGITHYRAWVSRTSTP